jgi:hypothetical protein
VRFTTIRPMKQASGIGSPNDVDVDPEQGAVFTLRSLKPAYVPEEHRDYVELLLAELRKSDDDAPLNIALTGHYGTGKSSVLTHVARELNAGRVKAINLSLPSLGIGDGRLNTNGGPALDKTNLIQKEIVKQLLYLQKPSATPASRFSRLDTFRARPAYGKAAVVALAALLLAVLVKLPARVKDAFPTSVWTYVDGHRWTPAASTIQWLSPFVVGVLFGLAAVWVQRLLQERLRITEFGAGPTKVTLSDKSTSYFDEYLDEIVYFFQTSMTEVVIFEDLDRFRDPYIFETLRELNLLLNNAQQIETERIRFVYAIRDSIFEQLDVDEKHRTDDNGEEATGARGRGESLRLMSTNRTKFFDLVVPMVPFISHRTSRDFIAAQVEKIEESQRPSAPVIDIVAAHLTDMRLIKNICNEYDVFRRRILRPGGLTELTADRLFASVVYKNLYLADYEDIRHGTSRLDTLYKAYRDWVRQQTYDARQSEQSARNGLRRIDGIAGRSESMGARLQEVLQAVWPGNWDRQRNQVSIDGEGQAWEELTTPQFWRTLLDARADITISGRPQQANVVVSFDKLQVLLGEEVSADAWSETERERLRRQVDAAARKHWFAAHATLRLALREPDNTFIYGGENRSLLEVAESCFVGADLALELLLSGFIDENFTLYITQFPDGASASAMNYIIKAVQPNLMDIDYHFGPDAAVVNTADIEAVIAAESRRLLGGRSVYNIEIFDYLLEKDPGRLDDPIARLASEAADDTTFIDAYLNAGKRSALFITRLSASWPKVFQHLIGTGDVDCLDELLDAALAGVPGPLVDYAAPSNVRAALETALPRLKTITTQQTEERAAAIAQALADMRVRAQDLAVVEEPLREHLITRALYSLTVDNLFVIFGTADQLSLDIIKSRRPESVYPNVVARLDEYLTCLDATQGTPTVLSASAFSEVLNDVTGSEEALVEAIATRATPECMVDDLTSVEADIWPAVARAHRLALTAHNVAAYLAALGIDEALAEWLTAAGAFQVGGVEVPSGPLALELLNTEALPDETKLALVESLKLDSPVPTSRLTTSARRLVPELVKRKLVADDIDAYNCLDGADWTLKEALIRVSSTFTSYMAAAGLSGNDVASIAAGSVPDSVKGALLEQLDEFESVLGPRGASALTAWAASRGMTPTDEQLLTLANKGGTKGATAMVKLLGPLANTIELDTLKSVLNSLGDPYDQLTSTGRKRPKVPVTDGARPVLARLVRAGIVSKYPEKSGRFEVSKRHR